MLHLLKEVLINELWSVAPRNGRRKKTGCTVVLLFWGSEKPERREFGRQSEKAVACGPEKSS
jgi:hypothetical protein